MSLSVVYAELNPHQRAIYPEGVLTLLAIFGFGSDPNLLAQILPLFGTEDGMFVFLKRVHEMNASPEIKSNSLVCLGSDGQVYSSFYNKLKELVNLWRTDFSANEVIILNKWIEKHAGFRDFFDPKQLRDVILLAVNTLWFKDTWIHPFNPNKTQPAPFYQSNGSEVSVPMMAIKSNMDYFNNDTLRGIRLKFTHSATAEFILGLPANSDIHENYQYQKDTVRLWLPKFSCDITIDLIPILTKLGLSDLFKEGHLTRITPKPSAIDVFEQRIMVSFDEQGAELKAVTYGVARQMAMMPKPEIIIRFDHPFHYRIQKAGLTLVQGYYDGIL